jgi:hypothetical protein
MSLLSLSSSPPSYRTRRAAQVEGPTSTVHGFTETPGDEPLGRLQSDLNGHVGDTGNIVGDFVEWAIADHVVGADA